MAHRPIVQTFTFQASANNRVTSDASGNFDVYSPYPVNGRILKVSVGNGTAENGSLFLTVSGTGETIFAKTGISGTGVGYWYPSISRVTTAGSALTAVSGNVITDIAINDVVRAVGSGFGNKLYIENVRLDYL